MSNGYNKGSVVPDDFAQDMELDEQPRNPSETDEAEADLSETNRNTQYDHLLTEAMEYGQELQRDYRDSPDVEQKSLLDIFSLVAYDNPRESVHGGLLDRKGRVVVAEELNSAILGKVAVVCLSTLVDLCMQSHLVDHPLPHSRSCTDRRKLLLTS